MAYLQDAHTALGAALIGLVPDAEVAIAESQSRPWASITFSGARHHYTLRMNGPRARDRANKLCTELPQRDFQMAGHIVADIVADVHAAEDGPVCLNVEALTVEAA
jgi:hypothetical protein